jgi:acetyl-CoA carboxylase carboxyl transferase subunit beta
MGLFSRLKPKIKIQTTKRDGLSGWLKCTQCGELIHANELEKTLNCCPKCNHHYRLNVEERIKLLSDEGSFQELFSEIKPVDPLEFSDTETYKARLERAEKNGGASEAVSTGLAHIEGTEVALGVMNFNFMGGSMGSVVGEKLTRLIELATVQRLPLIIVSSSGGARMQESIFSLMQMAKTSFALGKYNEAGLLFISVLTNPTTGGVTASFASLGDILVAEPGALIGFAGPSVIEQTIKRKLPPDAQKSEFLLERGMIDIIVDRKELKNKLSIFLRLFTQKKPYE